MLKRGPADWNAWRSSASLITPDLRKEADLRNALFTDVEFAEGSNLPMNFIIVFGAVRRGS